MKIDVSPLMTAIEKYIAKEDQELKEQLDEDGYVDAAVAVTSIQEIGEAIAESTQQYVDEVLKRLQDTEELEAFIEDIWPEISSAEDLTQALHDIFYQKFDELMHQFTMSWILAKDPELGAAIDDDRITKPAEEFIKGWSGRLANLMHLSTNRQIENILLEAQEKSLSIGEVAQAITDSGIREFGYKSLRVARTEVLRVEEYAHQEARVQNPSCYKKMWVHTGRAKDPRKNHEKMNGTTVFKRERFELTGKDGKTYYPMCPRDTELPAAESINCFCRTEDIVDDKVLGMTLEERLALRKKCMDEVDAEWEGKMKREESLKYADKETIDSYFSNGGVNATIQIEDLVSDSHRFENYTPHSLNIILANSGYEVKPLSRGSLKGVLFEDGGGYKVNFGEDGILQYHPAGGHHDGIEYYKISTGKTGTNRFDVKGEMLNG